MFSHSDSESYSLMRYVVSKLTGGVYMSINQFPPDTISMEKYVVYSPNGKPDDEKSIKSTRSDSITFTDPAYVDLAVQKQNSGTTLTLTASPAHTSSTLASDKWQSYWTRRERCCCFWNFLLTVALVVLVVIVVMATRGLITLHPTDNGYSSGDADDIDGDPVTSFTTKSMCTTTTAAPPEICKDSTCTRVTTDVLGNMNISADPCEDFYTYACGGFMERTTLSWRSPRKRMDPDIVQQRYLHTLMDRLSEDVAESESPGTQTVKTVFKSCTQFTGANIDDVKDLIISYGGLEFGPSEKTADFDLTELTAQSFLEFGISPFFDMEVTQNGQIGLYNRFSDLFWENRYNYNLQLHRYRFLKPSDYITRNENTDELLMAYKQYMGDFLGHLMSLNSTEKQDERYSNMIDDLYHFNIYLNRAFYSSDKTSHENEVQRCKTPMSSAELQYRYNYNITWSSFFHTIFNNTSLALNYTICLTSLSSTVRDIILSFPLVTIKRYVIFYLLTESDLFYLLPRDTPQFIRAEWESSAFSDSVYQFSDESCARQISQHIPMHYVMVNHIGAGFNEALRQLFIELLASIEGIIRDLYWIPTQQRQHLLTELTGLRVQWNWEESNDGINDILHEITDNYFTNMLSMIRYKTGQYLRGNSSPVLTKYHDSSMTLINKVLGVPMSTLQFSLLHDYPSVWYGTLGTYMAQTISQLFDIDALLQFLSDEKIDHRVALTIAFRLQCLLDEYSKYPVLQEADRTYYVQSDLTKSANFKDSLALRVAYNAYIKSTHSRTGLPGLQYTDDQLFFISYTQSLCEKVNDRGAHEFYIDTDLSHHSPGNYRVMGTLSHYKKFSDAFQCPSSSPMNPANKCTLF